MNDGQWWWIWWHCNLWSHPKILNSSFMAIVNFSIFSEKRGPRFFGTYFIHDQSWLQSCCRIMMSYQAIFFIPEAINYYILLSHLFVIFSINSPSSLSLSVLYARPSSPCSLGLPSPTSHCCFMFSSWWENGKRILSKLIVRASLFFSFYFLLLLVVELCGVFDVDLFSLLTDKVKC